MTSSLWDLLKKLNFAFTPERWEAEFRIYGADEYSQEPPCRWQVPYLTCKGLVTPWAPGSSGVSLRQQCRARPQARAHPAAPGGPQDRPGAAPALVTGTSLGIGTGHGWAETSEPGEGSGSTKPGSRRGCGGRADSCSWDVAQIKTNSPIPPWNRFPGSTGKEEWEAPAEAGQGSLGLLVPSGTEWC